MNWASGFYDFMTMMDMLLFSYSECIFTTHQSNRSDLPASVSKPFPYLPSCEGSCVACSCEYSVCTILYIRMLSWRSLPLSFASSINCTGGRYS